MRSPAELVSFLLWERDLESIEIGRRTHPLAWDTQEEVDFPIRSSLDQEPFLITQRAKSPPIYRIKDLNAVDTSDQSFMQIDRKRTVRRHFGGRVLTIVRNSVVLHNSDPSDRLPDEIQKLIKEERQELRSNPKYDYDRRSDELEQLLEPHMANRSSDDKPAWIVPLLTTYYSVKIDAVKSNRLKEIAIAA